MRPWPTWYWPLQKLQLTIALLSHLTIGYRPTTPSLRQTLCTCIFLVKLWKWTAAVTYRGCKYENGSCTYVFNNLIPDCTYLQVCFLVEDVKCFRHIYCGNDVLITICKVASYIHNSGVGRPFHTWSTCVLCYANTHTHNSLHKVVYVNT